METTIIALVVQYGPEAIIVIKNLVDELESKGTLTVADVQAEFADLKPWSAYKIVTAS